MKSIKMALKSLSSSPLKSTLTLITVGLGVGVLILALSVSSFLSRTLTQELEQGGIIVNVSNAEYDSEGTLEQVRPPQIDENVVEVIRTEVDGVVAVAPLSDTFWDEVKVEGKTYQIRSIVGSTEEYARVMGLELVAGDGFTQEDVETGSRVVILSESLAELLFGSPQDALGQIIQPPAREFPGAQPQDRTALVQNYTVIGVYSDPGELNRKSYGVADLVVPYTAMTPAGMNAQMARPFMLSTMVMKVEGQDFISVESQVRDVLTREYGDDLILTVWEGTPQGESGIIEEARQTVSTFNLVVNILGFVLLIAGSIGILSIMLVEILGKTKQISVERALGASRWSITKEYFRRGMILSSMSVILGVTLSVIFAGPLTRLLSPLLETMSITDGLGGVVSPLAVLIGAATALVIGGIFGIFPVFATLKASIADGIREV